MMNLKYYLRGLGIGVVVTALIMGIAAGRGKKTLSNEEIKERARALGMVEESQALVEVMGEEGGNQAVNAVPAFSAARTTPEPSPEESPMPVPEEAPSPTPGDEEGPALGTEGQDENGALSNEEPENLREPEAASDDGNTEATSDDRNPEASPEEGVIIIQVESGEGSFIVCQKLEDAGLVPLASAFDRYLYENGYDKRINIGTYEIPAGAGQEQIAKIIARLE